MTFGTSSPSAAPTPQYCDPKQTVGICCPATAGPVYITPGVTSIPFRAFSDCSTMTSITIPDSVTDIAVQAFNTCTNMKSIVLPEGLVNIGTNVFYDCTSLTSITIPSTVMTMGDFTFTGATSLTTLTLPNRLNSANGPFAPITTCPYLPDNQLMTYTLGQTGPSPACPAIAPTAEPTTDPTGTPTFVPTYEPTASPTLAPTYEPTTAPPPCQYSVPRLQLNCSPDVVDIVMCLSAFVETCTDATQCDVVGVYSSSDTSFTNNLVIDLGPLAQGSYSYAQINGGPTSCDNKYPPDGYGLAYNDPVNGATNLYGPDGYAIIDHNGSSSCTVDDSTYEPTASPTLAPTSEPTTASPTAPTVAPTFYPTTQYCDPNDYTYPSPFFGRTPDLFNIPNRRSLHASSGTGCCPHSPGHVTITPGVTSIPDFAFLFCETLTSITLPDSLTDIGQLAFVDCLRLTSLVIPEGVVSIGYGAIAELKIPSIVIPRSVTTLSSYALASDIMTEISLPNRFELGSNGHGPAYLSPTTCPYYPDALLITYNTTYDGSSPACIQPDAGTCDNKVTLNLSFPPQTANIVLCLSDPAATCTSAAQCDIIGVYTIGDSLYSTNLLVPLPTVPAGALAPVYTLGDHVIYVDNNCPLDNAGLVYNSTAYGFTNI